MVHEINNRWGQWKFAFNDRGVSCGVSITTTEFHEINLYLPLAAPLWDRLIRLLRNTRHSDSNREVSPGVIASRHVEDGEESVTVDQVAYECKDAWTFTLSVLSPSVGVKMGFFCDEELQSLGAWLDQALVQARSKHASDVPKTDR